MGKILAFFGAGVISFLAFFQVGSALRGDDGATGPGAAQSVEMRGCTRRMRELLPDESSVTKACECMYDEFAKKGYALTDTFTGDFEDMSRITRSCAVKYGARLQ
ncbi:hypothetical protein ACRAQ7_11365 [Erythrobacter sp. W53]|uniref:hypothetical protein n=1 Tax=Erythrobacter sp. W53 TaxID=3425947 RepID=UPI003D76832A